MTIIKSTSKKHSRNPRSTAMQPSINKFFQLLFYAFCLVSSLNVTAEEKKSSLITGSAPTAPHEVTSLVCGSCHVEILKEWQGSMHAQSSPLKDPIHGAFYRNVMGDPTQEGLKNKKGKYPVCIKCHAPNAAMQKKTKIDSKPAFNEGVNCVYCHTISAFKGTKKDNGKLRLGQSAYKNSTTSLQAPSGKNYSTAPQTGQPTATAMPFHPFPLEGKNASIFKANDLCMGCHDQRNNSHDVPLCATGGEYQKSGAAVNCQSCHMPMVNGHASHTWAGGHDKNMLRKSLQLSLNINKSDDNYKAVVTMKNLLPHKFPTGSPFRISYLKLTAFNADGDVVWQNFETHPLKEDVKAVMVYTLSDGKGNQAMPPTAKGVLGDTRLAPHEERKLEYSISGKGITVIRAEVLYNLLIPQLVKKLDKVLTPELRETKPVAFAEIRL